MSDIAMTSAVEPDGAPRIAVLDILRGVAILGILFMNINDMGQSVFASYNDIRHLGWSAADQIAWTVREVFANGTTRCLLEMMFGAGMVILTSRAAEAAGQYQVLGRYYLRNLILLVFGLLHVFMLLWPGDILHTYGIAALIAFLFVQLPGKWLVVVGLNMAVFTFISGVSDITVATQRSAALAGITVEQRAGLPLSGGDQQAIADAARARARKTAITREMAALVTREDRDRRGTPITWVQAQWRTFMVIEGYGLEVLYVWEAASTMLIGAGLFKLGVLQGGRSRAFYLGMAVIGYAVGIALRGVAAWQVMQFDTAPQIDWATAEAGRLAMTLGHLGAINALTMTVIGARLLRPFVAAGRTALTLYIAQTIICLWVLFPPFALNLYGQLSWAPLMLVAVAVDAMLLCAANIYLRHLDIAPVEWAWRSLLEGRRLPWRHPKPAPAEGRDPVAQRG